MANFVTVNDYEMVNAEHIVGFKLDFIDPEISPSIRLKNPDISLTISLVNGTTFTMCSKNRIKRFFEDLRWHFGEISQPSTYDDIYKKYLNLIGEEKK